MTNTTPELLDFRRWCTETGNFPAVDTIDRWLAMESEAKEALRARWAEQEDRENGK